MTSTTDDGKAPKATGADRTLEIVALPGETAEAAMARKIYDPLCRAVVLGRDISSLASKRGLKESAKALEKQVQAIQRGDLSGVESTLAVQANLLDLTFNEMLHRAAANAGTYLDATEVYMRLALKAQTRRKANAAPH